MIRNSLFLLVTLASTVFANPDFIVVDGDTITLADEITVVGSRVPVAMPGIVRSVAVIDAGDIEVTPARSVAELLASMPEIEVNQRQQYGVQSDLSVRGSTFEQVQVLVDGINFGNSQTGHHNMNLPLGTIDVRRLELLRGHGSSLYGAGAFGGTVNIATVRPAAGGKLTAIVGDNNTRGFASSISSNSTRFSVENFRTDGDRPNTDCNNTSVTAHSVIGELDVFGGYSERDFAAIDFYAPYPSREQTESAFMYAKYRKNAGKFILEPRVHLRKHSDRFVLFESDPDIYTNNHVTRRAGAELIGLYDLSNTMTASFGMDAVYEEIESQGIRGGVAGPALGDHMRRSASLSSELAKVNGRLQWNVGTRVDGRQEYTAQLSHSGAARYNINDRWALKSSAGTVFRAPSFTELYYSDPSNEGAADLDPEHGWTWDSGLEMTSGRLTMSWTVFQRFEKNLIDWVRLAEMENPWQVMNISEADVKGFSQTIRYSTPKGHSFGLYYSRLDKEFELPELYELKYSSINPKHLAVAEVTAMVTPKLSVTVLGRYRERENGENFFVMDLRLSRKTGNWRIFADCTNALDRDYEEIPGVLMPSRVVSSGVTLSF
jgi:iron complex outermembrane receptor protein